MANSMDDVLNKAMQPDALFNNPPTAYQWPELKPLQDTLKPVEPFKPDSFLPKNTAGWVMDVSHRMQSPPDFVAAPLIVALSSVIGRKCGVYPKQKDNWLVVPNLWGTDIGRPSTMKTPSIEEAIKPLKNLEIAEKTAFDAQMQNFEIDVNLQKITQEQAAKNARAAIKENREQAARDALMTAIQAIDKPKRKRHIVNDCTVEKLGEILNENPNGVLLVRDELAGWIKGLEREDRTNDKAFYLEAWNGNGRYCYDRIGRGTLDIDAACVSVFGGIQPSKLVGIVSDAIKGFSDDGFLQRLQVAVYPDIKPNWQYIDQYPCKESKDAVYAIFERIANWQPETKDGEFFALRFDSEAQEIFIDWLTELEEELRQPDIHPIFEAHLKKYSSLIPSLALITFIAENEVITIDSKIDAACLWKAICFGNYLKTHAERIFAIGLDASIRNAKTILTKIEAGKLTDLFGTGDIKRAGWTGLDDILTIKEALDVLCDFGYLREFSTQPNTGGRPSMRYLINPKIQVKA